MPDREGETKNIARETKLSTGREGQKPSLNLRLVEGEIQKRSEKQERRLLCSRKNDSAKVGLREKRVQAWGRAPKNVSES